MLSRLEPITAKRPSAVVLMIGINDLEAGRAAEDVARDIEKIVATLQSKLPDTKLVVQRCCQCVTSDVALASHPTKSSD